MNTYSRILDPVFAAVRRLTVALITMMVAVETYEIALRTITGNTPSWSKELVLLAMVWMGCLGSAVLHRERGHITLELMVDAPLKKFRRQIMIGVDLLILVFSVFLTGAGMVVAMEFLDQSLPGTNMPVGVSYFPLPVTGLLLCLAAIEHVLGGLFGSGGEAPDAD